MSYKNRDAKFETELKWPWEALLGYFFAQTAVFLDLQVQISWNKVRLIALTFF